MMHHSSYSHYTPFDIDSAQEDMAALHAFLNDRIRMYDLDLHPQQSPCRCIINRTAAGTQYSDVVTIAYMRSEDQSQLVEKLMGIEPEGETRSRALVRHPVIEVRLSADALAIELIVSPDAWWDQKNLIGKMELRRQRDYLRRMLRSMDEQYRFGFWEGTHLSDMHLSTWQLLQGNVLTEWLGTFADEQDWLRLGVWYDSASLDLRNPDVAHLVWQHVTELYQVYEFLLWTSNNNYHDFYERGSDLRQRLYA